MSSTPMTPKIGLALDVFLLDGKSRNLSALTIRYYDQQISWFSQFLALGDCHHLDQITPHQIRAYLLHLQEKKAWKSASVHSAARAIRAFLNFCVLDEMLTSSPMDRVKMPRTTENLLPAYTEADIRSLLAAANTHRDQTLLLCLLDSGCRATELLAWTVKDVNLAVGTVRVTRSKNRQERTVYLGVRSRRALIKLLGTQSMAPEEPIWRTFDTGGQLTYEGLKSLLQKLGKAADVYPCNAHRFRRTFALMSLRNGMNVYALQRIMGHSDLSVLRRYLALIDDDLREAHQRFGAVDQMLG